MNKRCAIGEPGEELKPESDFVFRGCGPVSASRLLRQRESPPSVGLRLCARTGSLALVLAAVLSSAFAAPQPTEDARATAGNISGTDSKTSAETPASREVPISPLWRGFEVIPGKNPNDWSFTLEPYVWALALTGDIGVKGFPPVHVDFSARDILQHLDWGVFARGEVRKGRWGVLADGFFAQLSASGDPPGPLYNDVDVTIQQGLVSLALAYRIISDRRGFLDIYAGARYNYLGIDILADLDEAGIRDVGSSASNRIFNEIDARVRTAVDAELQSLRAQLAAEAAILRDDVSNKLAANLESNLENRLRQDLRGTQLLRRALAADEIRRLTRVLRGEYRVYLRAALDARLAEERSRVDARLAQATAKAQARLAQARKNLSKAITERIQNTLPSSASGSDWWVDPIIGLRGQVNFTRWLFLSLQGDVGGFGAGSLFAANITATLGVNITRNIFLETGYRYFYTDRSSEGFVDNVSEYGLFSGIGVKF